MRSLKAYAAMGIVNTEEISGIWMILVSAGKTLRKRIGAMDALEQRIMIPALSRTDNETLICPECGTREAIDAALSVPEFSAGMTEQEKEEYKENVIKKIHENI